MEIPEQVADHERRITDLEEKQVPRIGALEEAHQETDKALAVLAQLVKSRDEVVDHAINAWPKAATYLLTVSGVLIGALTIIVGVIALIH